MKLRKHLFFLNIVFPVCVFTGCGQEETAVWKPVSANETIQIAVVGDETFYSANGIMEGIELACGDFYERTGTEIRVLYYDDEADYHQAIACANEIAADSEIAAVIVKDEIDYIDTLADIYEAAKKPFIITNGCYSHTLENGYEYLLADFINATTAGNIMGEYVIDSGFSRAAFCHSDTEYEEDELKGFQTKIAESAVSLCDTAVGPYTQEEFDSAYSRWQAIGVDVVCVSNYYSLNSDLVRMLRQKGSDIQVVSDYVMDTDADIESNGKYLDGTVIVPLYITGESEKLEDTEARFQEKYGFEMLEHAVQSYDLIDMLGSALLSGTETSLEFMEALKSDSGYEGLYGTVLFNDQGELLPSGNNILVFSDGGFRSKS